ncbi:hypothetical protein [Leekyejoonella antrihumi]|uniref:Uncharacterized protein n=1 Tax=Leekyejoonella antrihumi TaxID=1660198 RepID=A0A563E4F6_9MICO|nr:hypothetical protein [Leekyejoonella antrihumi]TWP37295.1 hypothetical protein FGL98_05925 [Leekyejoonella antrihumi]
MHACTRQQQFRGDPRTTDLASGVAGAGGGRLEPVLHGLAGCVHAVPDERCGRHRVADEAAAATSLATNASASSTTSRPAGSWSAG